MSVQESVLLASLRCLDASGDWAGTLRRAIGGDLPSGCGVICEMRQGVLLWRGPTETWFLPRDGDALAELRRMAPDAIDGCTVELTGAYDLLQLDAAIAPGLLSRLGSSTLYPPRGASASGRMADVPAVVVHRPCGELLILVDRLHLAHVLGWLRHLHVDAAG